MKKRLLSVLAFALAVSAGAAFVLYQLISTKVQAGNKAAPKTIRVFVAAHDLELGALIQERDLRTEEYLNPPAGAITKKEDIVGRGVTSPLHEDAPFFDSSLAPKGAGAGFASIIPMGMRAFAIHVNEVVGVAGFAVAGMRVDVLVSGMPPGAGNESAGAVSRTLLQNVEVLSAGQNYQKDAEGKPVMVQVVNVLVTPQQAEVLNLATDQKIQLILRNPSDHDIVSTQGAATSGLFQGGIPRAPQAPARRHDAAAAPQSPRTYTVEVFEGDKKTETTFDSTAPGVKP
jgi:pilus assembly protein CpaB